MPPYKPLILFLLFVLLPFSVFPQNLNETHKSIRQSIEPGNLKEAISQLNNLQKNNADIFKANNYDYLLARMSEKNGDFANAIANYQAVVNRNSILKEYALWHLSQIMRSMGNLLMERIYLQELSLIAEKSLLKDAIKKRFARSHFESENYSQTIKLLNGNYSAFATQKDDSLTQKVKDSIEEFNKSQPREDLVLLGEAYLLNNQIDKAKEVFNELVNNPPRENQPDDFALAGAKGLDKLEIGEENLGKKVPSLSDEEHFKRAEIYQFNRNFDLARLHYEAIVKNHSTSSKVPISMYQIGRGFGQERDYQNAVTWFERLQKEYPEDKLSASSLYQSAGNYANLDKTQEAVSRYEKYITENPDASNLERAYLNIIDAYRDAKDLTNALNWTAKAQEKFRGEMGEAVALFSQIRIHISQENWQTAIRDLEKLKDMPNLGGVRIAGGTNKEEVTFLRGFVLEKLKRFEEAIEVYLSLEDGLKNYYGWRATERLEELAKNSQTSNLIEQKFKKYSSISNETLTDSNAEQISSAANKAFRLTDTADTKKQLLARISRAYSLLPDYEKIPNGKLLEFGRKEVLQPPKQNQIKSHKNIADELLFLGLYDEVTPELETALRENLSNNTGSLSDFPADTAFTLAVFYKRGDIANRAIGYIEPLWKKVPGDYQINLIPRTQLELLYPKPYQSSLLKYGKEKQVDPRFVLSIMRQESRYIANIKSVAAARGLMQFISNTSNKMAEEMGIDNFQQDDLYNPPTAIRFGSHYINKIFKDFPNQPPAVAASYNGGEDRMMRWYKRSNTENPDRYVPEVIFSQTKDYVYKVMANYRVYQMLYDQNLKDVNK